MDEPLTAYQLRYCPARYIHPSQLPVALQTLAQALPDWRSQNSVNAWLITELALALDYPISARLAGLALFAQTDLRRTLGTLGAILHGQAIRQALEASTLARLHAAIGCAGHRFCLEHLELIIGPWPAGWQQVLPAGDLDDYLHRYGLAFWMQAMGEVDQGFARRLGLRIAQAQVISSCSITEEQRPLAQTLCLKIARHMSPTCLHLLD
ncbi:Yop protein translocation protein K [compost metagenome]